jgi:hypothetical protein
VPLLFGQLAVPFVTLYLAASLLVLAARRHRRGLQTSASRNDEATEARGSCIPNRNEPLRHARLAIFVSLPTRVIMTCERVLDRGTLQDATKPAGSRGRRE